MSAPERNSHAIPLSPSSPPEVGIKERSKIEGGGFGPQSPASPPMSVATKSYAPSYAGTEPSLDVATSQQSAIPGLSMIHSNQPSPRSSLKRPSPAPEKDPNDDTQHISVDDQGQYRSKRQKVDSEITGEDQMEVDSFANASNHDRQTMPDTENSYGNKQTSFEIVTNEATVHESPATDGVSLEQLQKDMGDAFLLCRSTYQRLRPDPNQHLLHLCGLSPLHATVAREDPHTKQPINKLRQRYVGKLKDFNLAGKNDVKLNRIPEGQKGKLRQLAEDPPEKQWRAETASKQMDVGIDFKAKLRKAMEMRPGKIKNNDYWEFEVLGHEKYKPAVLPAMTPKNVTEKVVNASRPSSGSARPSSTAVGSDVIRARRQGTKRSYDDKAFEGYDETYGEEDLPDAGALEDSEDGGGPRRKKSKNNHYFSTSPIGY